MKYTSHPDFKTQLSVVNFEYIEKGDEALGRLCMHMEIRGYSPNEACLDCDKCIGEIPLNPLKTIQPNLTKENLEETIKIYEVLL